MGRRDYDASYEKAYIERFRGRSAATRALLIKLDMRSDRAVANPVVFQTFKDSYAAIGTQLEARDAYFYARFAEWYGRLAVARGWYEALADLGDETPLREFYVRQGLATAAHARFTITVSELAKMLNTNLKMLKNQTRYNAVLVDETIKGCQLAVSKRPLELFLAQCIKEGQYAATFRVAAALGHELTPEEAVALGKGMTLRQPLRPATHAFVRRLCVPELSKAYIDELITHIPEKPDEILVRADDIGYEISTGQLEALYASIQAALDKDSTAIPPKRWVRIVEELARRSDEWRKRLPEAYEVACVQSIGRVDTGQAVYYAQLSGRPIQPIELYVNLYVLSQNPWPQMRPESRRLAMRQLEELITKILFQPPLDEHGDPKPD